MYNILICDDEKDIVSAIEIYLKTAVDILQVDLIVLDL